MAAGPTKLTGLVVQLKHVKRVVQSFKCDQCSNSSQTQGGSNTIQTQPAESILYIIWKVYKVATIVLTFTSYNINMMNTLHPYLESDDINDSEMGHSAFFVLLN